MDNSHKTARTRSGPSAPLKYLLKKGLLKETKLNLMLDYGCGKGSDANHLTNEGFSILKYDPYYAPNDMVLKFKYDYILCFYVLNVLEERTEKEIIKKIRKRLKKNGQAFFAVRRDLQRPLSISHGRIQRMSYPELTSIYKNKSFEIYHYKNEDDSSLVN